MKITAMVVALAMIGAGIVLAWASSRTPSLPVALVSPEAPATTQAIAVPATEQDAAALAWNRVNDEPAVEVSTEALARGDVKMADVNGHSLMQLLADLQGRLDYDRSQHGGNPGPDAAYLSQWIDTVSAELQARGFQIDVQGKVVGAPPIK